ncbi:hypothetical protein [Hyphomicrobium sp. MC8b]|uniref:hypothetical protein n=1 Tax=Hyphomicrobium sp. MC8b TaxID=300273 RepID=UPI00391C3F1D
MRLRKDEIIEGVPAKVLRDALRQLTESRADLSWYEKKFGRISDDPKALVTRLLGSGYLERVDGYFVLSSKALQLSSARFLKPISRDEAMVRFARALGRVEQMRDDDRFVFWISKLILFGSAADPKANDCGDVDIAVEVCLKPKYRQAPLAVWRELTADIASELGYAWPRGRTNSLLFPGTICLRFLKSDDNCLSLHDVGEIKQLGIDARRYVDRGRLLRSARNLIRKLQ